MNHLISRFASSFSLAALLGVSSLGCGTDDPAAMTRHQVCERLGTASCERLAACEPLVAQAGCEAKEMASCCPDGVCAEPVIADAERMEACEAALTTMSCSDLVDRDLPDSCRDLTDPLPMPMPMPMPEPEPTGDTGVLEVNWNIYAGGSSLSCDQFNHTTAIRIIATPPAGAAISRDFTCDQGSTLTTLPLGPHSIIAQARTAGGQVVQQTLASTVVVAPSGASTSFTFQVTTTYGQYCSQLATAVCNGCAPGNTTCRAESYADCCGKDGICGRPALADPQAFPACLSAFNSGGASCTTAPPVCAGSIDLW
jgi:hypothetical protein